MRVDGYYTFIYKGFDEERFYPYNYYMNNKNSDKIMIIKPFTEYFNNFLNSMETINPDEIKIRRHYNFSTIDDMNRDLLANCSEEEKEKILNLIYNKKDIEEEI